MPDDIEEVDGFRGYPRTPHIEGSGLQKGDDARAIIPFSALVGERVVFEEKVDAANSGLGFNGAGDPFLQSRGHFLEAHDRSVYRERHFNLLKDWMRAHRDILLDRLEDRYIIYGEWMGAVHSIFYDDLPHLFMEFDVWDRATASFLDTPTRRRLLDGLPMASVPVLSVTDGLTPAQLMACMGPSCFRRRGEGDAPAWQDSLRVACGRVGDDFDRRLPKLYGGDASEGGYGKVERDGKVVGRFKFVRPGFIQTIIDADEHWQNRIMVPNLVRGRIDVFPDSVVRDIRSTTLTYDPDAPQGWAPWAPVAGREIRGLGR